MGNGMNKIISGLYVGSIRDSKCVQQLQTNQISHIVCVLGRPRHEIAHIKYLNILAEDQPNQNLHQYFAQCSDFIHAARLNGKNVLIHCLAGASRSVTLAVAYLMSVTSLNFKAALRCVQTARTIASPNDGFLHQLQQFEKTQLRQERERMRKQFKGKIQLPQDEQEVQQLLIQYRSKKIMSKSVGSNDLTKKKAKFVSSFSLDSKNHELNNLIPLDKKSHYIKNWMSEKEKKMMESKQPSQDSLHNKSLNLLTCKTKRLQLVQCSSSKEISQTSQIKDQK